LALLAGIMLFVGEKQKPSPRLKITRQTEVEGKSVVFFKVDYTDNRTMLDGSFEKIIMESRRLEFASFEIAWTPDIISPDFWAPSQAWPRDLRKEFGVLAPTNAQVWKLQVKVGFEATRLQILKAMPSTWWVAHKQGVSMVSMAKESWNWFYHGGLILAAHDDLTVMESDNITNTATGKISAQAAD